MFVCHIYVHTHNFECFLLLFSVASYQKFCCSLMVDKCYNGSKFIHLDEIKVFSLLEKF